MTRIIAPSPVSGSIDVAAVDLGSNSFHMMVARASSDGELQVIDRLREPVRLAAGLNSDKRLRPEAAERALACLQRFGQRLKGLPPERVRVVGTNTLRRMKKSSEFIAAAEAALGHPLEIISGVEEARLVFGGVTHGMGRESPRRLVVDIGGGSTEVIIGRGARPRLMESVALGCVVHTQRYFADGVITRARMRKARLAARVELEFLERRYRQAGWDLAIGASGTIRGTWRVMMSQGWCEQAITREGLEKVIELVTTRGHVDQIDFEALREDRRPVFAGGLAVLAGVFDTLGIERMETSERALREGVLYDLIGRLSNRDVRGDAVNAIATRFGVDQRQAADIERTALRLLDQVTATWKLDARSSASLLRWAARLHEIGLTIAHAGYHKHSEYILRHADLQGFSLTDQRLLSALVRLHRGKFSASVLSDVPEDWQLPVQRLAMILRLSVLLHRSRSPGLRPPVTLTAERRGLKLDLRRLSWLDQRPLTRADLELETDYLAAAGFRLKLPKS
jgi:exopolyphosphatase / guanosine-5'-triphosphate,3'-diphosphate pyrophosphatase